MSLEIRDCYELDKRELEQLRSLSVSQQQMEFGGTFENSLGSAITERSSTLRGYCFFKQRNVVGIVILKRPPTSPEWVPPDAVSLHGLKIDQRYQGQGLGKEALKLASDTAATVWPEASSLILAVDADNASALALYRGFGMEDSGPIFSGRIGKEHRLTKSFDR